MSEPDRPPVPDPRPAPGPSGPTGDTTPPPPPPAAPAPGEREPPVEPPAEPSPARSASLRTDLDEVARARPERAFNLGAVVGTVLAVATVVFVVQNSHATDFEWLWFDFSLPLWTVLVGSLALGALAAVAGFTIHRRRRRRIERRREAAGRLREALPAESETAPARRRFPFFRRPARAG